MKKNLQVKIEVYEQGFQNKDFRHQKIFSFDKYFMKPLFIEVCRFVKDCLDAYNKGARGIQYGRSKKHIERNTINATETD